MALISHAIIHINIDGYRDHVLTAQLSDTFGCSKQVDKSDSLQDNPTDHHDSCQDIFLMVEFLIKEEFHPNWNDGHEKNCHVYFVIDLREEGLLTLTEISDESKNSNKSMVQVECDEEGDPDFEKADELDGWCEQDK